MKKGGNTLRILYSKTKEHPAIRFAQYWDIPEFLLTYAYNDIFIDGKGTRHALQRINATLGLIGKTVSDDRFDNFVVASKKYNFWQEKRLSRKAQSTLHIGKSLAENLDFSRTLHTRGAPPQEE